MPYRDPAAQREAQRQYAADRRRRYVEAFGGACKCGSTERLEFAGRQKGGRWTKFSWTWSTARLEAALAACELVCHSCRRRLRKPPVHGTSSMYTRHGCRCDECKEWRRLDGQRRREQQRTRRSRRAAETTPKPAAKPPAPKAPPRPAVPAPVKPRLVAVPPAAPVPPRAPLPLTSERSAVWASMVAKMVARQRAKIEASGRGGPRAA